MRKRVQKLKRQIPDRLLSRTFKPDGRKSSDIIKFLLNMKVVATINHNIDKDTAEYIVKEFGHKPILDDEPQIKSEKVKKNLREI